MELWNMLPDEVKLVLLMSLPAVGKGSVLAFIGICEYNFSLEKTFLLCSLGSTIKVGYYFLPVYGIEKFLSTSNWWIIKIIRDYFRKPAGKSKLKNISYFVLSILTFFALPILLEMGLGRQVLAYAFVLLAFRFFYRRRNKSWSTYLSLLILPNVGAGILPTAYLAYVGKIKLLRAMAITAVGSIFTIYLLSLGIMYNKPQFSAAWEVVKKVF